MEIKKLSEIAYLLNGYAFKSAKYVEAGIRIIRIANVQDGFIADDKPCYYPPNTDEDISKYMLAENDLLVSLTGNVGRVGMLTKSFLPAALNQRVSCIRIKDRKIVDKKYLYFFFRQKSFVQECAKASKGVAQLNLSTKWLENYMIPLPPLPEQERIVARIEELFSQLDNGVETLRKTKQQLAVYKRSAIAFALEPRGSACWTRTTVGDVCDCLDSMRRPVNRKTRALAVGKYPYYGANGETGRIDDYIFDEELVLVCEDETFVGRTKPFSYIINGKSWVNNHAHILRGKKGVLHNRFLNYVLSYYPFLPLVTGTTGRKKLTQSALLKAPITVCDYDTQAQIVAEIDARLTVCDSIERTVDTALQQSEAMRQSILKQVFEGGL